MELSDSFLEEIDFEKPDTVEYLGLGSSQFSTYDGIKIPDSALTDEIFEQRKTIGSIMN